MPSEDTDVLNQLLYDDGELTYDEMDALANLGLDDPDGWGSPGMDEYDTL